MRIIWAGLAVLLLVGCETTPVPPLITQCPAERPQVCTMEYNPVCAELIGGGKKQYASGCNACADDAVSGYLNGECPE